MKQPMNQLTTHGKYYEMTKITKEISALCFRVPESVYTDNQDLLGEVFIDTVDTVSLSQIHITYTTGIIEAIFPKARIGFSSILQCTGTIKQ